MNCICHGCKSEIKEGENKYHDTYSNIYYCIECTSKGVPIKRQFAIGLEKSMNTTQAVGEAWTGCMLTFLLLFAVPILFFIPIGIITSVFENIYLILITIWLYICGLVLGWCYLKEKINEWKK